eukprot:781307-Prymnesium_polylepis.2
MRGHAGREALASCAGTAISCAWHAATHCLGTSTMPRPRSARSGTASPTACHRHSNASTSRMLRCLSRHTNVPYMTRPSVSATRSPRSSSAATALRLRPSAMPRLATITCPVMHDPWPMMWPMADVVAKGGV